MAVGIVFSQGQSDAGQAEAATLAALATGAGPAERLASIDPPGQWAVMETVRDVAAAPLTGGPPGIVRYRCPLITDIGPVDEPYGALMLVAFAVPPERKAAVDDWYLNEHIELLMRADGWLRARRYEVEDMAGRGPRWTHLAFHELRDLATMDSEERKVARSTAWRAELEREAWFQTAGRWVFLPRR